ncbi:MAG: tetratricopeptide repeat protein [Candidatus Hodarchaeales archaeon]
MTKASQYLETAREIHTDTKIMKELADIYRTLGEDDKAGECLGELLRISDTVHIAKSPDKIAEEQHNKEINDFLGMVEIQINKNQLKDIDIEKLRGYVDTVIPIPKAQLLLGEIYYRVRQYREAIKLLERYKNTSKPNIHFYKTLGKAYRKTKDFDNAKKMFMQYIELIDDDAEILMEMGVLYNAMKNYSLAIEYYGEAIEANRENNTGDIAQIYIFRGVSHYNLQDYTAAIEDYIEAINANPKKLQAYHNLGIAYEKIRANEKAKDSYRKALELAKERNLTNKIRIYENWIKNL